MKDGLGLRLETFTTKRNAPFFMIRNHPLELEIQVLLYREPVREADDHPAIGLYDLVEAQYVLRLSPRLGRS